MVWYIQEVMNATYITETLLIDPLLLETHFQTSFVISLEMLD